MTPMAKLIEEHWPFQFEEQECTCGWHGEKWSTHLAATITEWLGS